jgi:hypothetical protein
LLDEMCSPAIAERLRQRSHDVVAALERDDLRGLADDELLATAAAERRATVSFDVGDFAQVALRSRAVERDHWGVILVSPRRFSASSDGIGALVRALDAALRSHPRKGDVVNETLRLADE